MSIATALKVAAAIVAVATFIVGVVQCSRAHRKDLVSHKPSCECLDSGLRARFGNVVDLSDTSETFGQLIGET
jgi:hypothetical protein